MTVQICGDIAMSLTLTDISKMSGQEIAAMLELDERKALAFIEAKLQEFEQKYGMSTKEMLCKYNPDGVEFADWIEDWHDLVDMQSDLLADNA